MTDLTELRKDLDEASAVAEVHAGVRLAYAAGLTLLAEITRLQADLAREREAANRNARLAADMRDERDTATARERERIADWFTQEGDIWRLKNATDAQCEYDRAAEMVRDSAGSEA